MQKFMLNFTNKCNQLVEYRNDRDVPDRTRVEKP